MEKKEHDSIIAFDTLYTNNHIQMMKIVMPYFDAPMRGRLAAYIKYLEFRHTLSYCGLHPHEPYGCPECHASGKEEFNINHICERLLPFCTKEEKQKLEQISSLFRSMEMYREISSMMEMFKNISPDFPADFSANLFQDASGNSQPNQNAMADLLMNMLSPEQKAMFEMFGGNDSHEPK